MWQLAPDYLTRVMKPAAERFAKGEGLPDFFTRYDLPLTVEDRADIEKALDEVLSFWNKTRNHPVYGKLATALAATSETAAARQTLLDREARGMARTVVEKKRRKEAEAAFVRVDRTLQLAAAKGYITPEEKAEIFKQYPSLPPAEIEKRIKVPVKAAEKDAAPTPKPEVVPATVRLQIRTSLAILGKRDLLDFLGLKGAPSQADMQRAYEAATRENSVRPANQIKTAAQDVLGVIKAHFLGRDPTRFELFREEELLDDFKKDVQVPLAKKRIDPAEIEFLVRRALELGISEARARQFIVEQARAAGAILGGETSATAGGVICPSCGTARGNTNVRNCVVCHAPLWKTCKRCGTENAGVAPSCAKCHFVFAEWEQVALWLRQTVLALDRGSFDGARETAARIEAVWGREGDAAPVFRRLDEARRILTEAASRYQDATREKRLFAARDALRELQRVHAGWTASDGRPVSAVLDAVEREIARIGPILSKAADLEARRHFRDAYVLYVQAATIVADSPEVRRGLSRAPEPASGVTASYDGSRVTVSWKESPAAGDLSYVVARGDEKESTVAKTTGTTAIDAAPVPGTNAQYTVLVHRGESTSEGVTSPPCFINADVAEPAIRASGGMVTGEWKPHSTGRVRVYRSGGASSAEIEIPDVSSSRFVDRKVENDRTYVYRILVEYEGRGGTPVRSRGIRLSATPDVLPSPLAQFDLRVEQDGVHAVWPSVPRGSVSILRFTAAPRWKSGEVINVSELASVPVLTPAGDHEAIDRLPVGGIVYYVAVTIVRSTAVVGAERKFVNLADVTGLAIEDFGQYLQARWTWPEDCGVVRVAWAPNSPPATAAAGPRCIEVSRGEYLRNGSLRINLPGPGTWYFRAFARGPDGSFSSGSRPGANAQVRLRRGAVKYYVTRGLFARRRITITLESGDVVTVPEIVVVAAPGNRQPQTASEGQEIGRISSVQLQPQAPRSYEFEIGAARKPFFLRAFFSSMRAYDELDLFDPPPSEARIT